MALTLAPVPLEMDAMRHRSNYLERLGFRRNPPITVAPSLNTEGRENENESELTQSALKAKGHDAERLNLCEKVFHKVFVPQVQHRPKQQVVTIFDWDDTLFCTSHVRRTLASGATEPQLAQQMKGITNIAMKLLKAALALGQTFIVTNAQAGWVESSAASWAPELLPVLKRVPVISARADHESRFPNQIEQWKIQAFLELQRRLDSENSTSLISIGDSIFEMDAAHAMRNGFSSSFIKTIKLKEKPTPAELRSELVLVSQKLAKIAAARKDLNFTLGKKRRV